MKGMVLSILLLAATTAAEASSRFIYDLDGSQKSLVVCDTMVSVKFVPGAKGLSTTFALQYDALRAGSPHAALAKDGVMFEVELAKSIDKCLIRS